jgi:hypothetical protein
MTLANPAFERISRIASRRSRVNGKDYAYIPLNRVTVATLSMATM